MSERELMIGDWVQVPSESNRFKCIMSTFDLDEAPLYRPIPLTEEILEKNGFEKEDDYNFYIEYDGLWWARFHPKETNYTNGCYSYIDIDHGCISLTELPCNNVHQLQHALRLCGIDKEIEL